MLTKNVHNNLISWILNTDQVHLNTQTFAYVVPFGNAFGQRSFLIDIRTDMLIVAHIESIHYTLCKFTSSHTLTSNLNKLAYICWTFTVYVMIITHVSVGDVVEMIVSFKWKRIYIYEYDTSVIFKCSLWNFHIQAANFKQAASHQELSLRILFVSIIVKCYQ